MTVCYIILGVILLLFLVLSLPIYVHISYKEELKIRIKYLFLTFPVFPPSEKLEKKRKRKKTEQKKKTDQEKQDKMVIPWWKQLYQEKGVSGLLRFLTELGKIIQKTVKNVFRHALLKKFELSIAIGGEDSAQIAMNYGKACSAVYPVSALLVECFRHQSVQVSVQPDFQSSKSVGTLFLVLRFRGLWLLIAGGSALFRFMRMQIAEGKAQETFNSKAA